MTLLKPPVGKHEVDKAENRGRERKDFIRIPTDPLIGRQEIKSKFYEVFTVFD